VNLPDPLIIGLCGRAGAGKDTAAAYLQLHYRFEPASFAAPLRSMIETLCIDAGIDYAYCHERHLKERPMPGLGVSYRHLAQTLGTDWGRKCIAPDLWVRLAELALGLPDHPVHDRIVMTDVRFRNEAAMIQGHRGVLVRIVRDVDPVRDHVSETEADDLVQWRTLYNTSSREYLFDQIDALMAEIESKGLPA
jgi:hypothetical protein